MAGQAQPGRLIGGRYRLLARLGAGGMGRVWRASDEALRIDVAVKEVWLPATPGPDADERLRRAEREARNAARLRDHPNVVAVHDVVVEDGAPWTVMQLVAGHTLEEHVTEFGPLSVPHTALVAESLLNALEAAHAAGIVHRDVKPANVMLADDGKVLLTDFGIAIGTTDTALTAAGTFLGSVEYIAPERARGTEGLPASDLFSLGVTLFQGVEGFSPFHRETATGTLTAVILDEAPPPERAGRLTPLITGLLEKDPAARIGIAEARRLLAAPEATPAPATMVAEPVATPTAATPTAATPNGPSGSASGAPRRTGGASTRGSVAMPAAGASTRGPVATPPRRPTTGSGKRVSQGTDQRRRVPAPESPERRRQPPTPEPRRATGTGHRPAQPGPAPRPQHPHGPARPAPRRGGPRPRALVLILLVLATIGGVLLAAMRHSSFDVSTVKVGDYVKVDRSLHITAKISQSDAVGHPLARKVLARQDGVHPDICAAWHDRGLSDVETKASVSFCLGSAQAADTAQ